MPWLIFRHKGYRRSKARKQKQQTEKAIADLVAFRDRGRGPSRQMDAEESGDSNPTSAVTDSP